MSRRYRALSAALGCIALAGCAQPAAVTSASAIALLRTGQPILSCREACVGDWRLAQPQAAQLEAGHRWDELAALTVRVNYQDDLSLYYLGRAAENLGYPGAAASYYRQSTYLSGTTIGCQNLSRVCGGLSFPRAAMLRLAAIERGLIRSRPRRPGPPAAAPEPEAPPAAGEISAPASEEAVPLAPMVAAPPPIAPPPITPPAPPPIAPPPLQRPASEYIEPPPAMR